MVPADKKWFARVVVAGALYEALAKLRLRYPEVGPEKKKELVAARAELVGESGAVVRAHKRPVPKQRAVAKQRPMARKRRLAKKRPAPPRPAATAPAPVEPVDAGAASIEG